MQTSHVLIRNMGKPFLYGADFVLRGTVMLTQEKDKHRHTNVQNIIVQQLSR